MVYLAGFVAMNSLTGTRRFLEGSDFEMAYQLGARKEMGAEWLADVPASLRRCVSRVRGYIEGPLKIPILAAAHILYEERTLDLTEAREVWLAVQPEEWPWLVCRRNERRAS